jgi:O-antigen chain-terminating methyltransferase
VRRALFWYTPQIHEFQEAAATLLNRICLLERHKFRSFLALSHRLEKLELGLRMVSSRSSGPAADETRLLGRNPPVGSSDLDPAAFYASLQERLAPPRAQRLSQLETYYSMIASLAPPAPQGVWMDIRCGTGDWLEIAKGKGVDAEGVDDRPEAVRHCRRRSLKVTRSDGLQALKLAADDSLALVSAFHMAEYLPFDRLFQLVHEAGRCLAPGGVLVMETPNPSNLLVAAEQFWVDPARQRPIPIELMEYLFEYFGFDVVRRAEVNRRPDIEHLPFLELELVNRLDRLLYGPQEYFLVGRAGN